MGLTIVETFVGCGGSHLGFKKNNFETVFVNDIWDTSLETLKANNSELTDNQVICEDINTLCKRDLLTEYNIKKNELSLLIGGVVCKGFSLAGVRNPYDDRNYLYISQLKLVEQFRPKISIIENVPGMKSMKILARNGVAPFSEKLKFNIDESIEQICKQIDKIIGDHTINRGKIIANNKKLSANQTQELLDMKVELQTEKENLDKMRKVYEIMLEKYKYSVLEDITEKYKEIGYKVHINKLKVTNYGGYTNRIRLIIVAVRNDIEKEWEWPTITHDNDNDELPNLLTVRDALNLLDPNINDPKIDKDNQPMNHRPATVEKFKKITSDTKFASFSSRGTSNRLSYDKPAPTLVPGHSSFQIHPVEHRSISVREGAAITGFPIDFKFKGSHTDRCMQIGNAIPVHLADAVAKSVIKILS
jgi:DNA (cytosine-5)-methyltransferase 1